MVRCEIERFIVKHVYFFNKHELQNKEPFLELNNLSNAHEKQSKPQRYVHCYLLLKLF
jgi:hypothetical protein